MLKDALQELGFPENEDYNGKTMEGVSYTQYNTANGERVSCSRAFIHPALERPNLHVTVESFVQKILIEDSRAYGVDMIKKSQKFRIKARKEVILSAGGLQSPKILMLSGIGPKNILSKHSIPVIKDLPVGQNLQNHPLVDIAFSVSSPVTGTLDPPSLATMLQYKIFKSGKLATPDADLLFYTSTTPKLKEKDWPDLQLIFFGIPISSMFMRSFDFKEDVVEELGKQRDAFRHGFGCFAAVLRPEGRGYLSIISNDPFDLPMVNSNYLDFKNDLNVLLRGIRLCQSLINTTVMASVGAAMTDTVPLSMCKDYKYDTDEYWLCFIQMKPLLHAHSSGTCKMGSDDDATAVLDSKLKVKGIEKLRVVDASVMPVIVSGTTHAATVMIGEKAADMIKLEQIRNLK